MCALERARAGCPLTHVHGVPPSPRHPPRAAAITYVTAICAAGRLQVSLGGKLGSTMLNAWFSSSYLASGAVGKWQGRARMERGGACMQCAQAAARASDTPPPLPHVLRAVP